MEGKYIDINLILSLQERKVYSKRNTEQNKIEFYNGKDIRNGNIRREINS
jgi:beta-galactosidase beta subunit